MAFRAPKPLDVEGLMDYAAKALSVRGYTVSELRTRLKKRAARVEDVDAVLSRLKEAGGGVTGGASNAAVRAGSSEVASTGNAAVARFNGMVDPTVAASPTDGTACSASYIASAESYRSDGSAASDRPATSRRPGGSSSKAGGSSPGRCADSASTMTAPTE